jgi:hypothetical protein
VQTQKITMHCTVLQNCVEIRAITVVLLTFSKSLLLWYVSAAKQSPPQNSQLSLPTMCFALFLFPIGRLLAIFRFGFKSLKPITVMSKKMKLSML